MQVKLEPQDDADEQYDFDYSSTGGDGSPAGDGDGRPDSDDDDDDDEFDEVALDAPASAAAALAEREADDEEHPALVFRRQQEQAAAEHAAATAAAAAAALSGDGGGSSTAAAPARPIFKDGKGGNRPAPVAIEIQLAVAEDDADGSKDKGKKRGPTYTPAERLAHLQAHKLHLVALLAAAASLNRQASTELLRARLLSLVPPAVLAPFDRASTALRLSRAMRGRAFERALEGLVEWWAAEWDVDWRAGIRYRSWAEGEVLGQALAAERADLDKTLNPPAPADRKGKGRASGSGRPPSKSDQKKLLAALGEAHGGEFRRSHKSLQRKAIGQYGSRDLSAVLFVCLCRALGLGARLVVSLQPVGWRMGDAGGASGAAKDRKGKGKAKATDSDGDDDDDVEMEPVPLPPPPAAPPQPQPTTSSSTAPAPGGFVRWIDRLPSQRVPGLRSTLGAQLGGFGSGSPGGQRLGGGAGQVGVGNPATGAGVKPKGQGRGHKLGEKNKDPNAPFDPTHPPIFWAEVWSRPDKEWLPVDPIRAFVRRPASFEPKGAREGARNRMVYVLGMEEDNAVKDLTPKYCDSAGGLERALKQRVPVLRSARTGAAAEADDDFWGGLVRALERDFKLARDLEEDDALAHKVRKKVSAMPTTMEGFKNHPDYVLERHVTTLQVIHPKLQHSLFKGEPVYRRAHVHTVKAEAGWLREGREVVAGEEPLKWNKVRAMTKQRQREIQAEKDRTGEDVRQPLFMRSQTRLLRPAPIKDGYIPRNQYGNMDLFVPTMLPPGAVHLKQNGIGKTAKKLGISYADACVNFQFKQKQAKAIPLLEGIVVAAENVDVVLEAHKEAQALEEEKARIKQRERVLKGWERLITGLKIRRRMQREYGNGQGANDDGIAVEVDLGIQPHEMPSPDKHVHALPSTKGNGASSKGERELPLPPRVKQEPTDGGFVIDDSDEGDDLDDDDDNEVQIVEKALNPRSLASLHAPHDDDDDGGTSEEEDEDESDVDREAPPARAPPLAAPTTAIRPTRASTATPRIILRRPTSAASSPAPSPDRRPTRAAAAPKPPSRATRSTRNGGGGGRSTAPAASSSSARKRTRADDSSDDATTDDSVEEVVPAVAVPARPARVTRAAAEKGKLKMAALEIDYDDDDDERSSSDVGLLLQS